MWFHQFFFIPVGPHLVVPLLGFLLCGLIRQIKICFCSMNQPLRLNNMLHFLSVTGVFLQRGDSQQPTRRNRPKEERTRLPVARYFTVKTSCQLKMLVVIPPLICSQQVPVITWEKLFRVCFVGSKLWEQLHPGGAPASSSEPGRPRERLPDRSQPAVHLASDRTGLECYRSQSWLELPGVGTDPIQKQVRKEKSLSISDTCNDLFSRWVQLKDKLLWNIPY